MWAVESVFGHRRGRSSSYEREADLSFLILWQCEQVRSVKERTLSDKEVSRSNAMVQRQAWMRNDSRHVEYEDALDTFTWAEPLC